MRLFFAALCVSLLSLCAFATPNKPVVVHLVTASWEGLLILMRRVTTLISSGVSFHHRNGRSMCSLCLLLVPYI